MKYSKTIANKPRICKYFCGFRDLPRNLPGKFSYRRHTMCDSRPSCLRCHKPSQGNIHTCRHTMCEFRPSYLRWRKPSQGNIHTCRHTMCEFRPSCLRYHKPSYGNFLHRRHCKRFMAGQCLHLDADGFGAIGTVSVSSRKHAYGGDSSKFRS